MDASNSQSTVLTSVKIEFSQTIFQSRARLKLKTQFKQLSAMHSFICMKADA